MRSDRGMTLLEILLGLMLIGLLSTFVINVVDSVVGLWQNGERRGRGDLVYATVAERFQADLRALHLGPRGWLIIDDYVAQQETETEAEWRLPRLRFLADGKGMKADDPTGVNAVELMWALIPENTNGSRMARLVRVSQVESVDESLTNSSYAMSLARAGQATTLLDGVAFLAFRIPGATSSAFQTTSYSGLNFPSTIEVQLERVAGNIRSKAPILDLAIADDSAQIVLRGQSPLKIPEFALIGSEWVRVSGEFPRMTFSARGQRSTFADAHPARTPVYFPEVYSSFHNVLAKGRRQDL